MSHYSAKLHRLNYMQSLLDLNISRQMKLGTLFASQISFREQSSFKVKLIRLIEYSQLIAIILLVHLDLYPLENSSTRPEFSLVFTSIAKILVPAYILDFQERRILAMCIFWALSAFIILKASLFYHVFYMLGKSKSINKKVLNFLSFIYKYQTRVFYLLVSAFMVKINEAMQNDSFPISSTTKTLLVIFSIAMMLLEFAFSLVVCLYDESILPTSDFAASKSSFLEIITLLHKFVIFLIMLLIPSNFQAVKVVFWCLNLSICFTRDIYFWIKLPFYHIRAISYQSRLLILTTSLSAACCCDPIFPAYAINFAVVTWIFLASFSLITSHLYLRHLIMKLLVNSSSRNPETALLRISILKQIWKKNNKPNKDYSENYKNSYLLDTVIGQNPSKLFDINFIAQDGNYENASKTKESRNKIFLNYLETLLIKYPNSDLIKLNVAYYYGKKFKMYGPAVRTAVELEKSPSYMVALSALMLRQDIQLKIVHEYQTSSDQINLAAYIRSQVDVARLKTQMREKALLQMKICSGLSKGPTDIGDIFQYAQEIYSYRVSIDKQIQRMLSSAPDQYLEPFALFAHYSLVVNHSIAEYSHFNKIFEQKSQKYLKIFKESHVNENTIYAKESIMLLSSVKDRIPSVDYCSPNSLKYFGRNPVGESLKNWVFPAIQDAFEKLADYALSPGQVLSLSAGSQHLFFVYNTEGHVTYMENFFNIMPFVHKGIQIVSIFREIKTTKEYIILGESGLIEAFTKRIGEYLNLKKTDTRNLSKISPEISRAIKAFQILESNSQDNMTNEEAIQITQLYSTSGQTLELGKNSKSFHCKIENQIYFGIFKRFIILEEIKDSSDDSETDPLPLLTSVEAPLQGEVADLKDMDENLDEEEELTTGVRKSSRGEEYKFLSRDKTPTELPITPFLSPRTENPLISNRDLLTTERSLTPQLTVSHPTEQVLSLNPNSKRGSFALRKEKRGDKKKVVEELVEVQSIASQNSRVSGEAKIFHAFERAIATNYYSPVYRMFIFALYAIMIGVLTIQINLSITIASDISTLNYRKDILVIAESRNVQIHATYRQLRSLWSFSSGWQNQSSYPVVIRAPAILDRVKGYLVELVQMNQALLESANYLVGTDRNKFFEEDVKMYATNYLDNVQSYVTLDTFNAVNRIIQTNLYVLGLAKVNINDINVYQALDLSLRNIGNSILSKNLEIVSLFLKSSDHERDRVFNSMTIFISLTTVLLSLLILLLALAIHFQFKNEKKYMLAFTRISSNGVQLVSKRLNDFIAVINEDRLFEESGTLHLKFFTYKDQQKLNKIMRNYDEDSLNLFCYKKSLRKYLLYVAKLCLLFSLLIALVTGNFLVVHDSIRDLHRQLHRLQTFNRMRSNMNLLSSVYLDLITRNGTTYMIEIPAPTLALNAIEFITDMQNNIPPLLENEDSTYDPTIEYILWTNACFKQDDTIQKSLCPSFQPDGQPIGLLQMLSNFENFVTNLWLEYEESKYSTQALKNITPTAQDTLIRYTLVLDSATAMISTVFNGYVEERVSEGNQTNITLSVIMDLYLFFAVIYLHIYFLAKIRQEDGKFKRVLQVFPANLVLSNFVLKSYLLKTSNDALNFVKNDI